MSVDYNSCDSCGESRYEEYVSSCNKCWVELCNNCLINTDGNTSRFPSHFGYHFDSEQPELMDRYVKEGFDLYDKDNDNKPYYEDGDLIDDSGIDSKHCPFCSGTQINTEQLYVYIVDKYNIDEEKEWKLYQESE